MDRSVVEFASTIPTSLKLKGWQGRYIQKRAMQGLVPEAIARRANMGLEMPHSIWFLGSFRKFAEKYFSKKNVEKSGLLDSAFIRELWDEHLGRKKDNGRPLWCVLNFLIW